MFKLFDLFMSDQDYKYLIIESSKDLFMNIGNFVSGIIVVVLGALMLADGVVGSIMEGTSFFFEDVNPLFKIVVALISIILGAPLLRESNGKW